MLTASATVSADQWTAANTPTVVQGVLYGDSCVSASFCVAVGQNNVAPLPLIEQWNGSAWTVVTGATVPTGSALLSVSCSSVTSCVAVGETEGTTLVEQWDGNSWTVVASPNMNAFMSTSLYSVSCTSAIFCKAVGQAYFGNSVYAPVALNWNGASWTLDTPPDPAGGGYFNAVSCTSSSTCTAVGIGADGDSGLIEQWNGTAWSAVASPKPAGLTSVAFSGVSCIGPAWCTTVGYGYNGTVYQTLIEMWSGGAWNVVSSPSQGSDSNYLQSVDCFSATSCSAVGYSSPSAGNQTESLVWDGAAWTLATTPNQAGATDTQLQHVSCVTSWQCVAVGLAVAGPPNPYVISAPIARSGYRFVAADGGVFSYGVGAPFLGSMGGTPLNKPIVGMAVMPAGDGYYLVASDGGIFSFGSAKFYGSTGSIHLNAPIVGMAVTADGGGYWLVASDGGIFSYGDAQFYGSAGSIHLNKPVVGMAATPNGLGYYLVASDGGIFNYGNAAFRRLDRWHEAQPADRRHGQPRWRAATTWSPPTGACSASRRPAGRPSTVRPVRSSSTSRSWG